MATGLRARRGLAIRPRSLARRHVDLLGATPVDWRVLADLPRPSTALERCVAQFEAVRAQRPAPWRRKPFRRWVGIIRTQLGPIHSLDSLASSFAREAALSRTLDDPETSIADRLAASPLLAAYVIRWHEIRDGRALGAWRELVG